MTNLHRTTLAGFLTYFVMSGMLAPIGIISAPMAEHFGQSVTDMTRQFSWLTGGILVGAIMALVIYDLLSIRRVVLMVYTVMTLSLISFSVSDSLDMTRLTLGIIGLGCGMGMAGAAVTIAQSYSEEKRASMLVVTDSCFSLAGIVMAWLASLLVAREMSWSLTYQCLAFVTLCIVVLAATSRFPDADREPGQKFSTHWPLPVWLCVFALFLYTLGQNAMLFWLPSYARDALGASTELSGSLVGQFWLGMFFAQIFVAWWVLKIGIRNLVIIAPVTATLFSIPVWHVGHSDTLFWITLLWGFSNLAILKAVLSYATLMVDVPSPRLVSLLLLGSTLGTAVSPMVTSQVVEWFDFRAALIFSSGCYGAILLTIAIARTLESGRLAKPASPA